MDHLYKIKYSVELDYSDYNLQKDLINLSVYLRSDFYVASTSLECPILLIIFFTEEQMIRSLKALVKSINSATTPSEELMVTNFISNSFRSVSEMLNAVSGGNDSSIKLENELVITKSKHHKMPVYYFKLYNNELIGLKVYKLDNNLNYGLSSILNNITPLKTYLPAKYSKLEFLDIIPTLSKKECFICSLKACKAKCSNCGVAYYCGKPHQIEDWNSHKSICSKLRITKFMHSFVYNQI